MPELTLENTEAPAAPAPAAPKPQVVPVEMDERLLSGEEKRAVEEFSKKINISDSNVILQYGAAAQKSVAGFSESALNSVKNKDLGEVGKSLSELVVELKGFGEDEEKRGIAGWFKKAGNKIEIMTNPVVEREGQGEFTGRIVPIYPLTAGVSQLILSRSVRQGLEECAAILPDVLPDEVRLGHGL